MSELDEYKKERQALIEARKVKATVPDGELEKKENPEKIVPKTFKEKWANYWYHYKALTFGSAVAVVLVFSFVWQITHPTVYDSSLSIVSSFPFESFQQQLDDVFSQYMDDYSGDGDRNLEVAIYSVSDPNAESMGENAQAEMAQQMKLMARLSMGEDFIFLVDDLGYEKVHDQMEMVFVDLSSFSDSPNVQGDKYQLNGTKLLEEMGMGSWEEPLYLCFVDFSTYGEKTKAKKELQEKYAAAEDFMRNLIAVG